MLLHLLTVWAVRFAASMRVVLLLLLVRERQETKDGRLGGGDRVCCGYTKCMTTCMLIFA